MKTSNHSGFSNWPKAGISETLTSVRAIVKERL
jgi:hypothetical protein